MYTYDFSKLLTLGYSWAYESYLRQDPVYSKILNVKNISTGGEQYTNGIRDVVLKEKPEGNEIVKANAMDGWTVYGKATTFGADFEITLETQQDTPPEKIQNLLEETARGWGEGVAISKEKYYADVFNKGGYTAGYKIFNGSTKYFTDPSGNLIYDGKPLFTLTGNARTAKSGTTYYNSIANTNLTVTNLQTAYNLMTITNAYDEAGDRIYLKPDVLLIPPALKFTAESVLMNNWVGGNANLDRNPVQNLVALQEWGYLTDTDAWFLGCSKKGIHALDRLQPVLNRYTDPKTGTNYITILARWGLTVDNWRYWVGCNLSTS